MKSNLGVAVALKVQNVKNDTLHEILRKLLIRETVRVRDRVLGFRARVIRLVSWVRILGSMVLGFQGFRVVRVLWGLVFEFSVTTVRVIWVIRVRITIRVNIRDTAVRVSAYAERY